MRIGEVVGQLSLSVAHPSVRGKRWALAIPWSLSDVAARTEISKSSARNESAEEIVAIDELGTAEGDCIGMAEGGEAAMAYFPEDKPLDAYVCCIVDEMTLDRHLVERLLKPGK